MTKSYKDWKACVSENSDKHFFHNAEKDLIFCVFTNRMSKSKSVYGWTPASGVRYAVAMHKESKPFGLDDAIQSSVQITEDTFEKLLEFFSSDV